MTVTTWMSPVATLSLVSDNWLLTPLGHLVLLSVTEKTASSIFNQGYIHKIIACFFLNFGEHQSFFVGPPILLFWTSVCISNGFQT